jgi:hypothetical protein
MGRNRFDETWHRLREWTRGQAPSERLAAQILIQEGFRGIDPSHPLGGPDGGKDAIANRGGKRFAMAVYFPRRQRSFKAIEAKFNEDLAGVRRNSAEGIAFVTNQELTLCKREHLTTLAAPTLVELYHLERITAILDSPDMAQVREQYLDIAADTSPPALRLGGQGGAAPSAGGGGGPAIGPNPTGGAGGPGGDSISLYGPSGEAPGAGGGGAGAVGEGAVGGEGGGGGEDVSFRLGPDEIGPGSSFHHLDIQVGKGGVGGPGEDTIVNLCDETGHVLRSIVAKGGRPGRPAYVPPPSRSPTEEDLKAGFKVTGTLAAQFIRCRDGLWVVVDGGLDWVQLAATPFRLTLPLLVEVQTGTIEPGTILNLKLVVRTPSGFQVHEQVQPVAVNGLLVRRSRLFATLEFSGSQPGLWRVEVLAGDQVIGEFPIEIRAPIPDC